VETRTAGSESGLGKRTDGNTGTAPQADSTSSAGKTKGNGSTGHGNRYLARTLGEAAVVAGRTNTFLGERYRRIAKRRGKKRAMVAVGRSILVIVWHLLANDDATFTDLGPDYFTRHLNPDRQKRNHIRQLEALGYTVTLTPAA
jgi:hypothetical protein